MTRLAFGAATDIGRVRRSNQDQFLTIDPLFVVADGMGGHRGGEVAAQTAIDTLATSNHMASIDDLIEWVQKANSKIVVKARDDYELKGMGTTVCVLVALSGAGPHRLGIANVGDSRLYRRTPEGLHQHTEDHSLVAALVRDGRLTRAEAATHPQRNIITRALGIDQKVLVDAWELVPVTGDRYLLCSDGLFGEIAESEIHQVLTDCESPQEAADDLIARACAAGGRDNVTAVVVDVVAADSYDAPPDDRVTAVRKALPDGVLDVDRYDQTDDAGDRPDEPFPVQGLFTWRLIAFITALVVVAASVLAVVTVNARSNYFVGVDSDGLVIYHGRPGGVFWVDRAVEDVVQLEIGLIDRADLLELADEQEFDSLEEAEVYVDEVMERAGQAAP